MGIPKVEKVKIRKIMTRNNFFIPKTINVNRSE